MQRCALTDPSGQLAGALPAAGGAVVAGALICSMIPSCWQGVVQTLRDLLDPADTWNRPIYEKPPKDAHDKDGAKAPGKPGAQEGFCDPKGRENWVRNPNGKGWGWEDADGKVWVPTGLGGKAHGGPHWDVQTPGGGYINVYPGGARR